MEQCYLQAVMFKNPWLVQLSMRAKTRVLAKVSNCPLTLVGFSIMADLNVLPLGSYDILIGIDWLEKHWSLINCKTKAINYLDEKGEKHEIQGIQKPLQLRHVTAS